MNPISPPQLRGAPAPTIVDLVMERASHGHDKKILVYLENGTHESASLDYVQLDTQARALAATLLKQCATGSRALLLFPPGLDFVIAFFGCLYAGVVAVPAYPPKRNQKAVRLQAILNDASPAVILATSSILNRLKNDDANAEDFSHVPCIATDEIDPALAITWLPVRPQLTDLAFLQYTSGSTATPKGVMVTHGNLIANSEYIRHAFDLSSDQTISVSWLPSYHDMGLIDGILQPIYTDFTGYIMPSAVFFQQPILWLEAISRFRATHSGGPDFAYSLCARSTTAEQRSTLDLSCWTTAYNGAEPVRAATLDLFAATFAACGFRSNFYFPCYGMAETTLMVSGVAVDSEPPICIVDAVALESGLAVNANADSAKQVSLVSSGHVFAGTSVAIVDPASAIKLPEDQVGEIWVSGSSIAAGYWNNPQQTAEIFNAYIETSGEGPFLRTGDLGFFREGELFVTGRLKDVIIVRGRNHYPHDIELSAERSHAGLRPSCNAAFSIERGGEEQVILVQEVERTQVRRRNTTEIVSQIRRAVAVEHGLHIHTVVLLAPGKILKTSSGKIQRRACKSAYEAGTLDALDINTADGGDFLLADASIRDELALLAPEEQRRRLCIYLQEVLGRLLDIPPLQINLNVAVVDLGLDSLGTVQLRHRLVTALGYVLTPMDLQQPTVLRTLVTRIAAHLSAPPAFNSAVINPLVGDVADDALSRGQQAIWFLHQLDPNGAAYNMAFAVDILSPIDPAMFERALGVVISRHHALRMRITVRDGVPYQQVEDGGGMDFVLQDTASWGDEKLNEDIAACSHMPFDLTADRLFRIRLYANSAARFTLLIVAHHIVTDFRSLEIFFDELSAIYATLRAGREANWRPVVRQQADFVQSQARLLASDVGARQAQYWKEKLTDSQPALALPYDSPRRIGMPVQGSVLRVPLTRMLSTEIRQFAKAQGVTPYTVLLAIFKIQLFRYTEQSDISVGSSVDQRSAGEFHDTMGYLVNQVVIRSSINADASITDVLLQLRESCQGAWEHQDYPFSRLVEQLRPERSNSRSPLFDVMFGFLRASHPSGIGQLACQVPGQSIDLGGLRFASRPLPRQATQFDLMLTVMDSGEHLTACWEFDNALFRESSIQRMHGHFMTLLQSAIADPMVTVGSVPLLTLPERQLLAHEWNNTITPFPAHLCVHQVIEAQVAESPNSTAVVDASGQLTFDELNRRANQLACHLRANGVGAEALVGICMRRSIAMVVAMLAVLKTGGAYIPLDPVQPDERLRTMINDANVPVLLTDRSTAIRFASDARKVICVESDWSQVHDLSDSNLANTAVPSGTAYVMYTSGSTGAPKGVMVTHSGLMNYLSWCIGAYAVGAGCGAPVNSSFSFDATVTSLICPLLAGKKVVLVPEDDEIAALSELLRGAERFSLVKITPAHLEILKSHFPPGSSSVATNAFVVGGEALPAPTVKYWREHSPATRIINEYGPTETVVGCCVYDVVDVSGISGNIPIGRPIANTCMYILDSHRQLVPVGAIGEIYIAGAGVARGYLNRPELTAERFVCDPFGSDASARMYRTGDLGRWLNDGNIEYVGRNDSQVKIRGYRIELGEVEAVLLSLPDVGDAAVTLQTTSNGSKHLAAHVVYHGEFTDRQERLLADMGRSLPKYMLPSTWYFLDQLPLTPNGKIDRKRLSQLTQETVTRGCEHSIAQTDLQQTIMRLWQDALGASHFGIHDNFFDVGGHSLMAAQIHQRLVERLGDVVTIVDMYRYPTINGLEQYLQMGVSSMPQITSQEINRGQLRRQHLHRKKGPEMGPN
ncbi:amino acid adenylation domain-containing protein [Janthinobacterium sp. GB4P2]|uniref:amino acid adenylation domain-containing protein n=1 Tax=Janthinobacterium sp. GB4P2 TaxID=3424189 RepID=UPI003F24182F